jgi:O-antigen ligase
MAEMITTGALKVLNRRLLENQTIFSWLSSVVAALLFGGIALIQVQLGGTRPAYAYPGYLLVAAAGLLSIFLIGYKRSLPKWPLLAATSLFFGYLLVCTLFSPLRFLAIANLLLILVALIAYFLSATVLTGSRTRLFLMSGLALLGIGHLAIGVTQYVLGNNYLPFGFIRPNYGARASGFYVCPDHFAGFLESLGVILFALALFARLRTWVRILLIYLAGAYLVGVLMSGSRGGYLSVGASLLALIAYAVYHIRQVAHPRSGKLFLGASVVGCVAVLLGFTFVTRSDLLSARFSTYLEPKDVRPLIWQAAVREFELNPTFGTGAGTFLIYGRKFRDPSIQSDPIYAHNDYLQLLAEYGVIAALLWVGFIVIHGAGAWTFIRRILRWLAERNEASSTSLALVVGSALAIIGLMVHSFFDFNLQIPGNTLFVALLFGILANPGVQWEKVKKESSTAAVIWRVVPVVPAVILFIVVWPRWQGEIEAEAARLSFLEHSYVLAIHHARDAVKFGNDDPDTFYYLGESRRQLANQFSGTTRRDFLSTAATAFEQGLTYFPMDERLLVKAGLNLAELGDFPGADRLFARAFEWSPNLGQVYAFYGSRLQLEGKNEEAAAAYRHSNQLDANQIATIGLQQTLGTTKNP